MRFFSLSRTGSLALWMLGVFGMSLFTAACEDTIDPFVEEDRFFTVFGFLDTASDEQFVRVVPLRRILSPSGDIDIDARVSSLEMESGRTVDWADSLIQFADGSFGHVFHASFRPVPGWTYRLTIERSDGKKAGAQTTIPLAEIAQVNPPIVAVANVTQKVLWQNIDFTPFRIEVWYRFINAAPNQPFLNAVLTYTDNKFGVQKPEGWEVLVRLTEDREDVTRALGISPDARLSLLGIGMRLTMSDAQWRPPGGVFDREVLVQPGTFSNVENGFGFLGSVNQYTTEWTLEPDIVERMGYAFPGKR